MVTFLVILFLVGYLCIALEHPLKINKAATALITAVGAWMIYMVIAPGIVPDQPEFEHFIQESVSLQEMPQSQQVVQFVQQKQIIESLGDIAEILLFLIGAMTVVELIDIHGGFDIITNRITTRNKRKLLWIVGIISFFMSAALDNLTTAIVMITLLRKIIGNYKERWVFAGIIIIAANSGGAWSPIGDITTLMLWVRGNVSASSIVPHIFLPSLISFLVPTLIAQRWLHGDVTPAKPEKLSAVHATADGVVYEAGIDRKARVSILILGVSCLVFVPIFKSITHLPPFMGILGALGIMWLYTEIMYKRRFESLPEQAKFRIPEVLRHVDTPTILFFLGILLAVSALQVSGVLGDLAIWLDTTVHNVYLINLTIGILSAVVDNVPLVAGAIGTYPVADAASIAASADPTYLSYFVQDGIFWHFLAYCAGVGGSILIIGSAAGVVIMGLERMNFVWYLKNISLLALAGYICGAIVYILQVVLLY